MKTNLYQEITNKVIEKLEQGVAPWRMPWVTANGASGFVSYSSGKPYSFLNTMLLMCQGGTEGEYVTFNQVKERGGRINKGAKAKLVTFFSFVHCKVKNEKGEMEESDEVYPVLKSYQVYQVSDTTIESKHKPQEKVEYAHDGVKTADDIATSYVKREGIKLQSTLESNQAYYSPSLDKVVVPMMSQFKEATEYYSTLFHELTHSTGTNARCGRNLGVERASFGSANYSREELVAEMGSAMSLGRLGMECETTFDNSVSYLKEWIKALKSDPNMIVWASSRAEKAVKYIFGDIEKASKENKD